MPTKGAIAQELSDLLALVQVDDAAAPFGGVCHALPALPGLTVEGFGDVSLPLCKQQADQLLSHCSNSVDNVWTLPADQVQMTNPEWELAIRKLSKASGETLGFTDVSLECELSKLLIYGEGGRQIVQQHSDSDRVAAKLLVQLPSKFTGGNVVVLSDRTIDMGKTNGTAAYKPHYVVYGVEACYGLDMVTSGFLVMAEYTLSLPLGLQWEQKNGVVIEPLSQAILKLTLHPEVGMEINGEYDDSDGEASRMALLLPNSFVGQEIGSLELHRLGGLDGARVCALVNANSLLPEENQLKFCWVCFHAIASRDVFGGGIAAEMTTSWYLFNGEKFYEGKVFEPLKLSFLNVDKSEPSADAICKSKHFALVGWPISTDLSNTREVIGEVGELATTLAETLAGNPKLREFVSMGEIVGERASMDPLSSVCSKICKVVTDTRDLTLAQVFLTEFFPRLGEKREFVSSLASVVQLFPWDDIGAAFLSSISRFECDDSVELTLTIATALPGSAAVECLMPLVLDKLRGVPPDILVKSSYVGLLWQVATTCQNSQVFHDVEDLFKQSDGEFLGPVVDTLAECMTNSSLPEERAAFFAFATKRRDWLSAEIAVFDAPGIIDLDFPGAEAIAEFLQSERKYFVVPDYFADLPNARVRVALLRKKISAPVVVTATSSGRLSIARVQILKAGEMPAARTKELLELKAEASRIDKLLEPAENTGIVFAMNKRVRVE